jgi:hypothetical protein
MIMEEIINALKHIFSSFNNGLRSAKSTAARDFLITIGLDHTQLEIGFNSGQFHHRKTEEFRKPFIEAGLLIPTDTKGNAPNRNPYNIFGKDSIVLPLKDVEGNIVNLFAYRFKKVIPEALHLNRAGVYPCFPDERITKLYICCNEIDAASLLMSGILENRDAVISLRDGKTTSDIAMAFCTPTKLDEIVVIGECAESFIESISKQEKLPTPLVIELPEDHSLNDMWVNYGADAIAQLIAEQTPEEQEPTAPEESKFEIIAEDEFQYKGEEMHYRITGSIPENHTLLEMVVEFYNQAGNKFKQRMDLLDTNLVKTALYNWSEEKEVNYSQLVLDIEFLTEELQKLRRQKRDTQKPITKPFNTKHDKQAKDLLGSTDLFDELTTAIGEAGVIGEERTRLLLFMIAASFKFKYNLHAVIQTSNIEMGRELAQKIGMLMPEEEQYHIDLTSSKTFRYYGNETIHNKLLILADYSGVITSKAITDLKKLQAKDYIVNDAPKKSPSGDLNTIKLTVKGHTSSIGACTQSKKHFENEPKTVLVGMDTSEEQEERLMEYDCKQMAGEVNTQQEEKAKEKLRYVINNLFPLEVVNPFARSLMLPVSIPNARMLTKQLHSFTALVTLFKQHQRDKDDNGKVITQKEDVSTAIDLFMDAILVNLDDLDTSTRVFFEKLKKMMLKQPNKSKATLSSNEIQKSLNMAKTTTNRFLKSLVENEYIKKEGHKNTGFVYRVTNWDEKGELRQMILDKLEKNSNNDNSKAA